MSEQTRNAILKAARGSWQRDIAIDLANGLAVRNPVSSLRGRAKHWAGKYAASFAELCARIRSAGVTLVVTPGPRGGVSSATWHVA